MKSRILQWSPPAGTLPELNEVAVKLVDARDRPTGRKIDTLPKAIAYLAAILSDSCVERAYIATFGLSGEPLNYALVSMGSERSCTFSTGEIARLCLLSGAPACVLAHNHTHEQTPTPSTADDVAARSLYDALHGLDIKLIDFIVVGADRKFYSYRENRRGVFQYVHETYTGDDIFDDDCDEEEAEEDDDEPPPKVRPPPASATVAPPFNLYISRIAINIGPNAATGAGPFFLLIIVVVSFQRCRNANVQCLI